MTKIFPIISRLLRTSVILLIHLYRNTIGLILPPSCRHHPTCSRYAEAVVREHGVVRGGWLTLRRLLRCHPWGGTVEREKNASTGAPPSRGSEFVGARIRRGSEF